MLDNIKIIFVDLYADQLRKPHTSVLECDFDAYFDQQVRELEGAAEKGTRQGPELNIVDYDPSPSVTNVRNSDVLDQTAQASGKPLSTCSACFERRLSHSLDTLGVAPNIGSSTENTPIGTPDSSRPSTPSSHILAGKIGPKGISRRARKQAHALVNPSSEDERRPKSRNEGPKKMRKWNDDGMAEDGNDMNLDYSVQPSQTNGTQSDSAPDVELVDAEASGTRTGKGQYVLKDLDDEVHSILKNANEREVQPNSAPRGVVDSSVGAISGLFRNFVGGKILTKEDLDKPMKAMEEHLLTKNVAREAAVRLCEGVERELIGIKTGSFECECVYEANFSSIFFSFLRPPANRDALWTAVDARIRIAMTTALQKILTPTTSLDILHAIETTNKHQRRPYTVSIVGVNGVGKSTNLSKLAFFLLQNNLSLLIAACDTFRSGAVEQLRVHARNLKELAAREDGHGRVELYERGYGKDAANIARDAIVYAGQQGFDVVLIDTAGRRHNDTRLMSSLEKFAQLARPDKILMVGEALVGSDSVAQARAFNAAFGAKRGLDGFIISKCDTVGEMVGTLVSMVHATGIPVVFLGVGQHYGDLRGLSVDWAVRLLMS